jgi:Ca2+-binding RTX toxin-like protein
MQGLTIRNIKKNYVESGVNTKDRKGLKVGLLLTNPADKATSAVELLSPETWLPSNTWTKVSLRFSLTEDIRVPENLKDLKPRVFISDFTGDSEVEEVPVPGDFIIRRAVIKGTTNLYSVPATNDAKTYNWFFQGFGVDYTFFKEPVNIDLSQRLIKILAGPRMFNSLADVFTGDNIARNIIGTSQNDILVGDERDNVIEGFAGADAIDGKAGVNTVSYINSPEGVEVSLEQGRGYRSHAEGDTFVSIQNVLGSKGDDIIVLGPENGSADGLDGKNIIATSG